MAPTTASRDAEHEIATIRCLLAQQIHILDHHAPGGALTSPADRLMRRLLDRDRDLRSLLCDTAPAPATADDPR